MFEFFFIWTSELSRSNPVLYGLMVLVTVTFAGALLGLSLKFLLKSRTKGKIKYEK